MKKISQIIPFGPKPSNFGPNDVFSEVLFSKFRETSEKLVTSHRLKRTKETQITQKKRDEAVGTAYCFSVVNIGEFMENTNNIMNANVAGSDAGGHDPITEPGENGQAFTVNFGDSIEPTNEGGGAGTLVETGANFDVVVHFKSDYCIRHWSLTAMQTDPDWNNGAVDYPLNSNAF